jgi:retinol dehydrogenase-12
VQSFPSRIVVVASRAHEKGHIQLDDLNYKNGRHFSPMFSYHHSKLANVLFAKELARR